MKTCNLYFDFFCNYETFFIRRRIQQDTAINAQTYSCKVPIIHVRF